MISATRSHHLLILPVLFVLALGALPRPAAADERLVDCGIGRRVSSALRLPAGRDLVVRIRGACRENLVIARDNVTLRADGPGATLDGSLNPAADTVRIEGARGIKIEGLVVRGGRNGAVGVKGALFTVENAIVESNAQNGVVANFNSTVTVNASQIRNNGQTGEIPLGRVGVLITDSSAGVITNSTVSGNASVGISVQSGSSARIGLAPGNIAGPNTIADNGSSGISIFQTAHGLVHGNTIRDNVGSGVYVEGGSATIVLNAIESNDGDGITVTNDGGARIGLDIFGAAPRRPGDPCNCTNKISGNVGDGIEISNGANANLYGNLIELNGRPEPGMFGRGVVVSNATARSAGNNTIRSNADDGVGVFRGQFQQAGFLSLAPNTRDIIMGNGTARRFNPNTGFGVIVFGAATANLNNFLISGSFRDGVVAFAGGSAILRSEDPNNVSVIENNGTTGTIPPFNSFGSGVNAFDGGTVELRGITVRNNKTNGLVLGTKSSASVRSHVITDNAGQPVIIPTTISGNANAGIGVFNGSALDMSANATITGNGTTGSGPGFPTGNGIAIFGGSVANIRDSTISFNRATGISVGGNSQLSISTTSADIVQDAAFRPETVVSDNGLDGILVSSNSSASMTIIDTRASPLRQNTPVSVTRNGRFGIQCFQSVFSFQNFTLPDGTLFNSLSGVTGNTGGTVGGTSGHQTNPDPMVSTCP